MARNYVAEVKERDVGQPCFLLLNLYDDIGLDGRTVILDLPEGTGIAEAQALRDALHSSGASLRLLK
ncbi:hypothetical protein [Sphingomonas sp. IW22]|uniref:hypothetical protein n=1 Tax=Sphingomonas sp. IW22 TaxID=3242489 RepID=UPI0035224B7B